MRVAIFGLGYVGTVCGACLASHGHEVVGVDVQAGKVELVNEGRAPIIEPGLQELLERVVREGKFRAVTSAAEAVAGARLSMICVGTPPEADGSLDLSFVEGVVREIGEWLRDKSDYHVVAIRSTVPPGTVARCIVWLEEASGRRAGEDFGVVCNPEFLREGCALKDFENPPYILAGTEHDRAAEAVRELYAKVEAPVVVTGTGPAEIIKYVNNSFHALKVAFANEVGSLCRQLGVDGREVMDLVCQDRRLNISPAYLSPGCAYGGSCLPKDLGALNELAARSGIETPVLASIQKSNAGHIERAVDMAVSTGKRKAGLLGLSFKENTDDLRESPVVKLAEALLARGMEVRIYDPNVNLSQLVGANREFIRRHIGNIAELLTESLEELVDFAEVVVAANKTGEFERAGILLGNDHVVVDLVGLPGLAEKNGDYLGICW